MNKVKFTPPHSFKNYLICSLFLFFSGCAKTDISAPLLVEAKNQEQVIEQFLTIPENASDELKYLISDIKKTEEQYHFLYAYVQRNGMPNWGSSESNVPIVKGGNTKTGNIASNSVLNNSSSTSGSGETYFIPLIDTVSKEVKSYIFCRKFSDGKISYKTYNKQAILASTAKDSNDVKLKGIMLSVFGHFERKINKKNNLLLPFPYNYNLNNVELKFTSSLIERANNIINTATSGGLVKMDGGCQEAFIQVSAFDFFQAFRQSSPYPLGTTIEFSIICGSGGATLVTIISQPINGAPTIPSNPPSSPVPTPPNYNPSPNPNPPPVYNPPSYPPYIPYIPPIINYPGTGYGGGGNGLTPIYGGPNNNYPPNWIEDPNNPWISPGAPMLDLIGMPGESILNTEVRNYANGLSYFWANKELYYNSETFPEYDVSRDGPRDSDGYRKNGTEYDYGEGIIQNFTNDNGSNYSTYRIKSTGEIIHFPGVTITNKFTTYDRGWTSAFGGIHAPLSFSLNTLQHEYGHYLQSLTFGAVYYNNYIIPNSLYSASTNIANHKNFWTEISANQFAISFFGINSAIALDPINFPR